MAMGMGSCSAAGSLPQHTIRDRASARRCLRGDGLCAVCDGLWRDGTHAAWNRDWHEGRWLRWVCFSVPLLASLLVYYLFVSATTLACAAAVGVAMLLQWPRAHTPQI